MTFDFETESNFSIGFELQMDRSIFIMTNESEYSRLVEIYNNYTMISQVGYSMNGYQDFNVSTIDPVYKVESQPGSKVKYALITLHE